MGYWLNRIKTAGEAKKVAHESIKFQDRKKLMELANKISVWRNANDYSDAGYASSGIAELIYKNHGVTIVLRSGSEIGVSAIAFAGVEPPQLDANNPIIASLSQIYYRGNKDLDAYGKFIKDGCVNGTIDDAGATVGGDISKIVCPVYVTPALCTTVDLTDVELAAVILHEVGHIQYYFRTLMRTVVSNLISDAAANRIMETQIPEQKIKIIKDVERMLDAKVTNPETVCKETSKEAVYMHLVRAVLVERAFITGGRGYANRTWERAADDYVARLGGATELATALYKMEVSAPWIMRNGSYQGFFGYFIKEATFVVSLVVGAMGGIPAVIMTSVIAAFVMVVNDPSTTIYDHPQERLETLRRGLVEELEVVKGINTKTANTRRDRILAGIAKIDELLKDVRDKYGFGRFVMEYMLPSGVKERKAADQQKQIERFLSNDLRVGIAKLEQSKNA